MDTRPKFPLSFVFKIHTPSNDFSVYDAHGRETAYTRQKMFRLAEQIEVFRNSMRDSLLYRISADRIIDFNACYRIMSVEGEGGIEIGSVRRKGIRSLWRISYRIYGGDGTAVQRLGAQPVDSGARQPVFCNPLCRMAQRLCVQPRLHRARHRRQRMLSAPKRKITAGAAFHPEKNRPGRTRRAGNGRIDGADAAGSDKRLNGLPNKKAA